MFTVKTAQWKKIDKITLDKKSPQRRNCRKNILSILQPALTVIFVAASNASGSSIDLCSPPSVKCSLTSDYHPQSQGHQKKPCTKEISHSVSPPGSLHSTLHSALPELDLEGMKLEEFNFQLILKIPVILLDCLQQSTQPSSSISYNFKKIQDKTKYLCNFFTYSAC